MILSAWDPRFIIGILHATYHLPAQRAGFISHTGPRPRP
jgi:hypothetical protein